MTERKRWLAGCLSALLSLPLAAAVPGPDAPADLARGKAMAQKMCSRCHDDDGNGGPRPNRSYPKLAGLDREYLYKQIYDLKTQRRRNPATNGRGEELSAADVVNVSAWFAAQGTAHGGAAGAPRPVAKLPGAPPPLAQHQLVNQQLQRSMANLNNTV
ncbi:c-type cytochrome, partial [Pseudomonas aeruginosa]